MNIVNKITMEYLADHNYISDNNKLEGHSEYSLNDLKFYRKRIVNLVKREPWPNHKRKLMKLMK